MSTDTTGRVAIAGDWHGDIGWVQTALPRLHRQAPDVTTVLQVGDFGLYPERRGKGFVAAVDYWAAAAGIDRVLVTPGNHEDYSAVDRLLATKPGEAVRLSNVVWVLPRGFRFTLGEREWMSFGGAASVDRESRTEGRDWWASEAPTEEDVEQAIAGGPVDVMLTHETVNGATREVEKVLRSNPLGWGREALAYSSESREKVTRVWNAVHPKVLAHGHMHIQGEIELPDRRRVYSLGCNREPGNFALLDTATLEWTWIDI